MTDRLTIHVGITATRTKSDAWGDTQYAEGLIRAFTAIGVKARLFFRGETPVLSGENDVVLRIIGPFFEDPIPGLPNLLWIISPPNIAPIPALKRYQKVFVASQSYSAYLHQNGIDAAYLPQATELGHFHPSKQSTDGPRYPVIFVGGYAPRAPRALIFETIRAGFDIHVWGPGWEGIIPDDIWRGERVSYDDLAPLYADTRIILNTHMPEMASMGIMSNRSYDALAAGAMVVSDQVRGFSAPHYPELIQAGSGPELVTVLHDILSAPAPDLAARIDLHNRVARYNSFDAIAAVILSTAQDILAKNRAAAPVFAPNPTEGTKHIRFSAVEAAPKTGHDTQIVAVFAAAKEVLDVFDALQSSARPVFHPPPACPTKDQGVLHAMMPTLRQVQSLALSGQLSLTDPKAQEIYLSARRLWDIRFDVQNIPPRMQNIIATRHMRGEPLWGQTPENHDRDALKHHLVLWPRRNPPALKRPVGVFLHLFYHDLAARFAPYLDRITVPHSLYISTDTTEKATAIARTFPQAEIRVIKNRGRDIFPKFYGFHDRYSDHDIILHLHGKKSVHSSKLDTWLAHNLSCLLPRSEDLNRLLSLFQTIPDLGLVTPVIYQPVLRAAHWGANTEIAQELTHRIGLSEALPDNGHLRFPVGSMFWGRVAALRPLLDTPLALQLFPPESGQLDGTTAHAIERLIGVSCEQTKHHLLAVAPSNSTLYRRHQKHFTRNRDVAGWLASGGGVDQPSEGKP